MNRIRHNSLSPIHCLRASIYCSLLIYFSVAIAIITTKYQKHYFYYCYLLLPLPLLSYYFATKHFAADIKFLGVVELTTQLLILENILWLPLCRINKFGLNTLPSKAVAIPYTCGLSNSWRIFWARRKPVSQGSAWGAARGEQHPPGRARRPRRSQVGAAHLGCPPNRLFDL